MKKKLFSSKHVVYKISTRPFNWECERRFRDFLWLRETLVKQYPCYYVPPMPSKDRKRSFDDFYLQNRIEFLQYFIDCICEHKELRSSDIFLKFLQINSSKDWNNAKKRAEKEGGLIMVRYLILLLGHEGERFEEIGE